MAAADEPEQLFGRAARDVTSLLSTPLGQGHRQNQAVVPWSEKLPHTVLTCRTNWNRPVTVNSPFFTFLFLHNVLQVTNGLEFEIPEQTEECNTVL